MTRLLIDGRQVSHEAAKLFSFHGDCVFSTMRSYGGEIVHWSSHWQRLCSHAEHVFYPIPSEEEVRGLILRAIDEAGADQKIRIIISPQQYVILLSPYEPPPSEIYRGVDVITTSIKVHPDLSWLKTGNSLPYRLAQRQALLAGAFEGLLTDHQGYIVDGSRTSPMLYDGQEMIALRGGLDGIMREQALGFVQKKGVPIVNMRLREDEFDGQMLLANSLLGVVPVGEIRSQLVQEMVDHFRMDQSADTTTGEP